MSPDAVVYALGGKPAISSDGTNFFVVWGDSRDISTNGPDIYGARVAPDGTVLDPAGIPISTFANNDPDPGPQYVPSVASDGTNYLVVWVAHRAPDSDFEVFAARVAPDGTVLDPDGLQITEGASPLRMPSIVFDGENFLVAWRTSGSEIHATRVTSAGTSLDGPTGFKVGSGFYPYVAFDGTNYLVVWHGFGDGTGLDIFGARVSKAGEVLDSEAIVIASAPEDQDHASVDFDGTNYLVAWGDHRRGNKYNGTTYGARVSPAGVVLNDPAIKIADYSLSGAASETGDALMVFDGTDHFVAWNTDNVPQAFRNWDIYGTRVAMDGTVLDPQAIPVGTAFGHQFNPVIGYFSDTYLLVWSDSLADGRCAQLCGQLLQKNAYTPPSPPETVPDAPVGEWLPQTNSMSEAFHGIWGFDKTHVYAVGEGSELFHFDGSTWTSLGTMNNAGRSFGIWGTAPSEAWSVGWCGTVVNFDGVQMNETGCNQFQPDTQPLLLGIWATAEASPIAVGVRGDIVRHDGNPGNSPERWQPMASPVSVDLHDVWGSSGTDVYAVGEFGTIVRFDGSEWSLQPDVPTVQSLNGVWGTGPDDVYVVGDFGTILHYDGETWTAHYSGTTEHLTDVFGLSPSQVFAVGFNGTILRFDGKKWSPDTSGTTESLEGVWGSGDTVWAVGDSGTILELALPDGDNDGVTDDADNCPSISNPGQADADDDGLGDECDEDDDNDGVADVSDNCPLVSNAGQDDADNDGIGDPCDADRDGDGIENSVDNCPLIANADQLDADKDDLGNACDTDNDNDGMPDSFEIRNGLNRFDPSDAALDDDGDGLTNLTEFGLNTDPKNPDTDNDGVNDGDEIAAGTDPTVNVSAVIQIINSILLSDD